MKFLARLMDLLCKGNHNRKAKHNRNYSTKISPTQKLQCWCVQQDIFVFLSSEET